MAFASVIVLMALAAPDFQLQTAEGETHYGRLVEVSTGQISLQTQQGKVTVPLENLTDVTPVAELAPAAENAAQATVWVELVDGSRLAATAYRVAKGRATMTLVGGQTAQLATTAIRGVRLLPAADAPEAKGPASGDRPSDEAPEDSPPKPAAAATRPASAAGSTTAERDEAADWARILDADSAGDLIVIRKKGALDYQSGVLGDVTDTTVGFKLDDEQISVKRSKVAGLVYYHAAGKKLPASHGQLVDRSGSRLEIAEVSLDSGTINLTTPAGFRATVPLDRLAALTGRVQYLSDLEPVSAKWHPLVAAAGQPPAAEAFFRPRRDEAVDGGDLRLDGKSFAKGLSLYSRTEVVYRLPPGQFKRLKALAGIDDRARPVGNARLEVWGDQRKLFETDLRGDRPPVAVDVDLTGVSRLRIVADFGDEAEVMDVVDLCDARILQ
jgi:hypothetical protein